MGALWLKHPNRLASVTAVLMVIATIASCNRPAKKREPDERRFDLCSAAARQYAREAVHPDKARWHCGFLIECVQQTAVPLSGFERGTIKQMLEQGDCFTKRSESYHGGCDWF